jgi:hypothetical protein
MNLLALLLFFGLGWYGAAQTVYVLWKGTRGAFLFTPPGAGLYAAGSVAAFLFYFGTHGAASAAGGTLSFVAEVLALPVLLFPYAVYLAGLCVETGRAFFSPLASVPPLHSYDKGDAAMARRDYGAAIAFYREDLARWPGDQEALLRLGRALVPSGQAELAAMEFVAARLDLLKRLAGSGQDAPHAHSGAPGAELRDRQEKLLVLILELGDLYAGPLASPERARRLYEDALQELHGAPGSDALRARLKMLAAPPALDAGAAPGRMPLDG